MAGPGRDTKLTPDRYQSILADLRKGNTRACAAMRAGIGERTLATWMAKGKRGEEPYVAFSAGVKKAERDAERRMVGIIRRAARTTWTAAAWWLERKFPESWRLDSEMIREVMKEIQKRRADGG